MDKIKKEIKKQAVKKNTFMTTFENKLDSNPVYYSEKENKGVISFDHPTSKVNILSSHVLELLSDILDEIKDRPITSLWIRSEKKDQFIAGANIEEIKEITTPYEATQKVSMGNHILNKLAELPYPTIAIINGPCLGGGCELALACDFRIAYESDAVKIGLPEVNLGIIPGFGGTQRLPKLIGLQRSLPLITAGKCLDAKKAYKTGLVDLVIAESFLEEKSDEFLAMVMHSKKRLKITKRRKKESWVTVVLEQSYLGRWLIKKIALKQVMKKTKGHYPAPVAAVHVVVDGYTKSIKKGLLKETEVFSKLVLTDVSKQLIHLFFIQETVKKQTMNQAIKTVKPVSHATVIGAGLMGAGIAWALSYRGVSTRLKDVSWEAVLKGMVSIKGIYKQLIKRRSIKKQQAHIRQLKTLSGTIDKSGIGQSDLIVEAIVEDMSIKKQVFRDIESSVSSTCVIASNTSSLSIKEMSKALKRPERFIGLHFFSPVNRMPLVEIIPSPTCSKETLSTAIQIVKRMKKTPIIVKECPGFLVNRILLPYLNEAIRCVQDGVSIKKVDQIATSFGMPIGPLALCDEVGLDVGLKVAKVLEEGYGERMKIPELFHTVFNKYELKGKKGGSGFYVYTGKQKKENSAIYECVSSEKKGILDKDVESRLIMIMIKEAIMCLDEKIVATPEQLDLAMIMGIGFPPFRGGLLKYAQSYGLQNIVEECHQFSQRFGSRFEPCETLLRLSQQQNNIFN